MSLSSKRGTVNKAAAEYRFSVVKAGIDEWCKRSGVNDLVETRKMFSLRTAQDGSIGIFIGEKAVSKEKEDAVFDPIEDVMAYVDSNFETLVNKGEIDPLGGENPDTCKYCMQDDKCKIICAGDGYDEKDNDGYANFVSSVDRDKVYGRYRAGTTDVIIELHDFFHKGKKMGVLYSPKEARFHLYKHYSFVLEGRLGIGHRVRLPLCVEGWVKHTLPAPSSAEKNATTTTSSKITDYVGFKKANKKK